MNLLFSRSKGYTFLLLILPSLIIVSWLNVFTGNANYSSNNYLLTFILPACVFAYIVSLITAEYLHEGYKYTFARVFFTISLLICSLLLFSYALTFLGFDSQFLTANIGSVQNYENKMTVLGISTESDPREIASKFYSFQLVITMILIVIFFSIASVLFKDKKVLRTKKEVSKVMKEKQTTVTYKPAALRKKTAKKKQKK